MNIIWAGSEESYEVVIKAQASVRELAARVQADGGSMPDVPPIWSTDGPLAIIYVTGSLVDGYAGWGTLFGVTGYSDIEDALTAAVSDPNIKSILLYVESSGGSVNGVQPLCDYILKLRSAKPINTFINRVGASAGYWVGCSALTVWLDPMSITGSIGCLQIQTSMNRMFADAGIDKTVIRSGEYKALGNPYEPLSDLGRAEMQSQVDDISAMFVDHVANARGVDAKTVVDDMGGGRTFLGKRAKTAGLVDKIQTRDQAVASAKKIDKAKSVPNNPSHS